jgi:hypothetical protein
VSALRHQFLHIHRPRVRRKISLISWWWGYVASNGVLKWLKINKMWEGAAVTILCIHLKGLEKSMENVNILSYQTEFELTAARMRLQIQYFHKKRKWAYCWDKLSHSKTSKDGGKFTFYIL